MSFPINQSLPLFLCWTREWQEASFKSTRNTRHLKHKSSAAQRLAVHRLSFYIKFPIFKLDLAVFLTFRFLQSLQPLRSSPLFTIGWHFRFSASVDAAYSFSNVPHTNCCSGFNLFLGKEPGVWRNPFALPSSSDKKLKYAIPAQLCNLYAPPLPFMQWRCTSVGIAEFLTIYHSKRW